MRRIALASALLFTLCPARAQVADVMDMPADVGAAISTDDLLRTWGWLVADRFNLSSYDFTDAELQLIFEGLRANVKRRDAPTDLEVSVDQMQEYFALREEEIRTRQYRENQKREREFFDGLFGRPEINSLGTGLHYEILAPGSGAKPSPTSMVEVNYEGRLLDGTLFDTSAKRDVPAQFRLDGVIPAWQQGLRLIGVGGKIKLYVPNKLAYGQEGRPNIPSGAALIFEVELLRILDGQGAAPPPEAPAESSVAPAP